LLIEQLWVSIMGQLENMQLFVKVVELGSITKTANQLNIAKSAVSRRLTELEAKLGVKLIQRTTRKSNLTEAGELYLHKCHYLIDEIEALNNQLSSTQKNLSGHLKIAIPLSFGIMHLIPAIDAFLKKYTLLKIDIHFSDRKVDIIEEGFDLAFRIGILEDSSFNARKITQIRHSICASPDYLTHHGQPENISELKQHKLLKYSDIPNAGFNLISPDGKNHVVNMEASHRSNNGDFLKYMALSGHGITLLPTFITGEQIKSGELINILPTHKIATMHAYALYPNRQYLPQKVRILIDFLIEKFGDTPYWDN